MPMRVIYGRQTLPDANCQGVVPNSIFLAGPTPYHKSVPSWRPDALRLLEEAGFDGTVFIPEDKEWGVSKAAYRELTRWEWAAMDLSACTMFWVPRDFRVVAAFRLWRVLSFMLKALNAIGLTFLGDLRMPAFTTNVEWGLCVAKRPERTVLGCPLNAKKMGYLIQMAEEYPKIPIPVFDKLEDTLHHAMVLASGK